MAGKGLTPKQQRFVSEYLVDCNATQAAIRAGYSAKTAHTIGPENLGKPEIAAALSAAMADRSRRTEITADRVLKEYARLAFLDIRRAFDADGNLLPVHDLDDDTAAAIAGLEVEEIRLPGGEESTGRLKKVKLSDKKGALDSLAKHLGMFTDKHEITIATVPEFIEVSGGPAPDGRADRP